jgi:hypothetical protein
VQAAERRPDLFNRDFSRSFLRHFERQRMSDSVDRASSHNRLLVRTYENGPRLGGPFST